MPSFSGIRPDDTTNAEGTVVGAATAHAALNDESDSSYIWANFDAALWSGSIDDFPGDFLSMTTIQLKLRYDFIGLSDDQFGIRARMAESGSEAAANLTDWTTIVALQGNTTGVEETTVTLANPTAGNKATWDAAALHIETLHNQNMGPDSGRENRFVRAELLGTYAGARAIAPARYLDAQRKRGNFHNATHY